MAKHSTETRSVYLQELKAAAEAQMRRPAPKLDDDGGHKHKKQKLADGFEDASEHVEGPVSRYAYAAADTLARGCTAFLGSCGFRRERSSTKEMLDVLNKVLPEGTKLQLVKVGCNGLVVITAEAAAGQPAISPTAVVQDILQQIETRSLQRTKFCQRIIPAELTCTLTATALKDALATVVKAYIIHHKKNSSSSSSSGSGGGGGGGGDGGNGQQQPVKFAVAYKNRDNVTVAGKQDGRQLQKQQDDAEQQQQQQQQQQTLQGQQQQHHRQQHEAVSGALQPVPHAELVDRARAIELAAAVMTECCRDTGGAIVDLVNPQVVLLLEVVPLSRHQLACAVAAVPASMVVTKPKLAIKPTGAGGK